MSKKYLYIRRGVETSSVHNTKKQTAPVAGHLKIRWDIAPDYVIDVTSSIKTLRITIVILIGTRLLNFYSNNIFYIIH